MDSVSGRAGASDGGRICTADIPDLPDAALRSAIEFVLALAHVGQKVRPAVVVPTALKPYLKSQRLDAAGLRAVRRILVHDSEFRERVGSADMSHAVDELGTAWLRRAEGWEAEVRQLNARARRDEAEATATAALRKAEKRREAAEQVATRGQADLLSRSDALLRETKRREQAEDEARTAVSSTSVLQAQITDLHRELERVKSKLVAEVQRAEFSEAELAAVSRRLSDTESVRDQILIQRAESGVERPDQPCPTAPPGRTDKTDDGQEAAARALSAAAAATRDVAAALEAAGTALGFVQGSRRIEREMPPENQRALAGVKPLRPRNNQRTPIPIPGGVYGDSVAAAEHLLRATGARVVVDGYNVAKLAWPQRELVDQRECCIHMLEDLTRRFGTDIRVVFDGAEVVGASARRRLVRVQFSSAGISADDVIKDEIRQMPAGVPAVVVTNDREIIVEVRSFGANVVSAEALIEAAGRRVPSRTDRKLR